MNFLITGTSRGIGHALAKYYSQKGTVYGISRSTSDLDIEQLQCDLTNYEQLKSQLNNFLSEVNEIDTVILNAGVLGKIQSISEANINELKETMEINLWSQKIILDLLIHKKIKNVIAISSGAAVKGSYGWSGYSLSKAALNMLIQLYADEYKDIKFIALAPGLVHTHMQDQLAKVDTNKYKNIKRLHDARGTKDMPQPDEFIKLYNSKLSKILEANSGSFIDIRKI
jgi:benzil reductase ((S)-benzoin forming)